jgi:NADPH:quinone reductase-like Zn-dependent oxidoreductase
LNAWDDPITLEDVPRPEPGSDEVLVKVHAASINPIDGAIVAGYAKSFTSVPLTLGTDFAGEVVAAGADVTHVKPGDAVYGMSLARGTFAEYAAVKGNGVARKPQSIDYVSAVAVPLTGLTAWQTLFKLADLQSGERVLIHGAGGGIGSLAVQLAKDKGAYVIAHDKGDKESLVLALGADEFIDAETQRFEEVAGDIDVILDTVGGDYINRSFDICGPGDRYVTPAGNPPSEEAQKQGFFASGTFTQPTVEDLNALAQKIDAGKLKVVVARTFPLEQVQDALVYRKAEDQIGKVVLTVG